MQNIINNDCNTTFKSIAPESIDLVITDPPYGVNSNELNGINYKDTFYNVKNIATELYRVLKNNTRCYIFTAQKTLFDVIEGFNSTDFRLHQKIIWHRPNLVGGTNRKTYDFTSVYEEILLFYKGKPPKMNRIEQINHFDVLKYAMPQSNYKDKRFHIHQKPLKLIEHLVLSSSNKDDLILDPYAGAGTTAVACENTGRNSICIEIQSEYCDIANTRIQQVKEKINGVL